MQTGVGGLPARRMLGIRPGRVVALLANLPAHRVPDLMQVLQWRLKHGFGVAPDLHFTLAHIERRMLRPRFPMKWLNFDSPCSRSVCMTSLRTAVAT